MGGAILDPRVTGPAAQPVHEIHPPHALRIGPDRRYQLTGQCALRQGSLGMFARNAHPELLVSRSGHVFSCYLIADDILIARNVIAPPTVCGGTAAACPAKHACAGVTRSDGVRAERIRIANPERRSLLHSKGVDMHNWRI